MLPLQHRTPTAIRQKRHSAPISPAHGHVGCQVTTKRSQRHRQQHDSSVCKPAAVPQQQHQASITTTVEPSQTSKFDAQAMIEFLKEDLTHLFDDRGIDASMYEEVVDFRDPITKFNSLGGYLFNIAMLRRVFNPTFTLHAIGQTAPTAITTRWTMAMEFTASRALRLDRWWAPTLTFTGTSTYVFNPDSGKICRHIDMWDSVSNQEFFSLEAFLDFFKQLLAPYRTPSLETPSYTLLKRRSDYEIRSYEPFLVAETAMDAAAAGTALPPSSSAGAQAAASSSSSSGGTGLAGPGNRAFNRLAGYIFGKNAEGRNLKMTTPVFTTTEGVMQFVIGPSAASDIAAVPAPLTSDVTTRRQEGGVFAVRLFNGIATDDVCRQQAQALRASLARDKVAAVPGAPVQLARYNDPSTPALLRRNEVLLPLQDHQLGLL